MIWILSLLFLISGCENKESMQYQQKKLNSKPLSIAGDKLNDVEKMERCRRELDVLKKIDNVVYTKRKIEFDKLISGASLYTGVRNEIGNYTQNAVDALYLFKADKLCADISNDVLNGLAKTTN
ncbi:hypothetical protein AHU44_23335 [Salmonella enterica subsp. diarizonae]|nr:hypothetical protein [Salmonella enterica subsp. diarizonae]EHG6066557.1 hypothetical protein [Salmonella enterica subsp. diarizonae serovar 61:z52:z53]EHG6218416.1 hypothetical protein [Salmonella enterica subsp. diarizonae serovar 61:z52:z53]EKL9332582.1 hypothetical protein [Salmonella enterica]